MLLDDADLLGEIPLFQTLEPEQLRMIAFAAERVSVVEGTVLFRQGEQTDRGYVIRSGSVLMTETYGGVETEKAIYGPGSLVGEMALFAELERPATAITRADSEFVVITRQLFHKVLNEYPEVAAHLQGVIRERLAALSKDIRQGRPA